MPGAHVHSSISTLKITTVLFSDMALLCYFLSWSFQVVIYSAHVELVNFLSHYCNNLGHKWCNFLPLCTSRVLFSLKVHPIIQDAKPAATIQCEIFKWCKFSYNLNARSVFQNKNCKNLNGVGSFLECSSRLLCRGLEEECEFSCSRWCSIWSCLSTYFLSVFLSACRDVLTAIKK